MMASRIMEVEIFEVAGLSTALYTEKPWLMGVRPRTGSASSSGGSQLGIGWNSPLGMHIFSSGVIIEVYSGKLLGYSRSGGPF